MSLKNIKDGIINATANVLSAPAQIKSALSQRQSTKDFNTLKEARKYKGAPDFNSDGTPTDANKARSLADEVKTRLNKPFVGSFKKGGKIKKTGLALVHKGETVVPARRTTSDGYMPKTNKK
jgi:hypothetical protein